MKCEFCNKEIKFNRCYNCVSKYRRYVNRLKCINLLSGKCSKCGYDDVSGLDFHHIDPKTKDWGVSYLLNKTDDRMLEEIKKCVLLCSNCHRKEHYEDREYLKQAFDKQYDLEPRIRKGFVKRKGSIRLKQRKVERPSKEELYNLIWSKPTVQIAKQYGVSDKAVEKWCKQYDISKPPRGYWARNIAV